jgi:hypothetical protein
MSLVASLVHHLPPLTGGGFWAAFAQVALVYYGFAAAIHWLIPGLFEVESVQVGERRPGQVRREALLSIGEREGFRVFFPTLFDLTCASSSDLDLLLPSFSHLFLSSSCVKESKRARLENAREFAEFIF